MSRTDNLKNIHSFVYPILPSNHLQKYLYLHHKLLPRPTWNTPKARTFKVSFIYSIELEAQNIRSVPRSQSYPSLIYSAQRTNKKFNETPNIAHTFFSRLPWGKGNIIKKSLAHNSYLVWQGFLNLDIKCRSLVTRLAVLTLLSRRFFLIVEKWLMAS